MTPELIVFDCDGVLVDTEYLVNELVANSLTEHGLAVTPKEAMGMFLGGTMLGVEKAARQQGAILPENWVESIYQEMFERIDQGVDVIPGIFELLDRVEAAGIAMAIASNGPMEKMRKTLRPHGIWDRFAPHIFSREQFEPKPAPDMIEHAMKVFGVAPSATVMIDDSVSGCAAGRRAGARVIGFATEGQGPTLAREGAEIATSMGAVAEMLAL